MINLNTCALCLQFSPCCRGLSVWSGTLPFLYSFTQNVLQSLQSLTPWKLSSSHMSWAVSELLATGSTTTTHSCVSTELIWPLCSSSGKDLARALCCFLQRGNQTNLTEIMGDLFQVIILKMDKDTVFEVLFFPVFIVADGVNQFAINLLSCQTLNIIKQSVT